MDTDTQIHKESLKLDLLYPCVKRKYIFILRPSSYLEQAYRNFGTRVNNLKKRLDEMKKALPDPNESPVVSPEIEAPSPENSPADAQDNTEAVDMDLSDEEINNGVKGHCFILRIYDK